MRIPLSVIWISAGLLLGISFVFWQLAWCFIPALIFLFYAIEHEESGLRLFIFGSIVGALQYAGSFFWVWTVYPLPWMAGQSAMLQFGAIGLHWVLTSTAVGFAVGFFAIVVKRIIKNDLLAVSLIPIVWVLSELLRSFFFSVYSLGPGSSVDIAFSYGYIGYLLALQRTLLQFASIAGVYSLSYLAALIGVCSYLFVRKRLYKKPLPVFVLALALIILLFAPTFSVHAPHMLGKKVIALETYFDEEHEDAAAWEPTKKAEVRSAVAQALALQPDVIVMPEDTDFGGSFNSVAELSAWVRSLAHGHRVVVVDNTTDKDSRGEFVVRAHAFDTQNDQVYYFDKKHLVPEGEFLSYIDEGILRVIVPQKTVEAIKTFMRFKAGVTGDSSAYPSYLPGVISCFEAMVPWSERQALGYRNPGYVVHQISHGIFHNPFSLEYELDTMLQTQAVWNNAPIVSAGNMTDSKLYLPDGTIREQTPATTTQWWSLKEFDL